MKKKIAGIIICMLMIIAVLPSASSINKIQIINVNHNESNCEECDNTEKNDDIISNYVTMQDPPAFVDLEDISSKPIPKNTPDQFSWMNYNGKNWVTPPRDQGNCGSCWAFAAIGIFESMIKIKEDCAEFNPDLSEQYVLSCLPNSGSCRGGSSSRALRYIKETTAEGNYHNGVPYESCFEYYADDDIPCSDKCANWEEQIVPLLEYGSFDGSREEIKTQIMEHGPIAAPILATNSFKTFGAINHNPDAYFPKVASLPGYNHIINIIGWKDSALIPTGGYWICKNSWGELWGYDGFFNIAYGSLNIDESFVIWADYDPDSHDWAPVVDTGGPYGTILDQETQFDASSSIGVEGEIIDYSWDFGDEYTGSGITTSHTYIEVGKYTVTLTVTDSEGNQDTSTTDVWIQESNEAPNKPSINGPTNGQMGRIYSYTFISTDIDGNDIWYTIDWGDGETPKMYGPFESDSEVIIRNSWNNYGSFTIKAKAKDVYGEESEWGELEVNMPRVKQINKGIFFLFFEKLINIFTFLISNR